MTLTGYIINTSGKRLSRIEVEAAGMSRATIRQAEQLAREWATEHGMRVVRDIVSQGEYRAWVEPIPAGRQATMRQTAATNARIAAKALA